MIALTRRQPVVVETEFSPARSVEQDATARLGLQLQSTGDRIEGVLSVILPQSLKHGSLDNVDDVIFQYATHFLGEDGESARWPSGND
ncbi:MAG: hypothetical protein OXI60_04660 [Acidiferrobacterales bacterium]|nr:hypothetical protein [Acidiferrobacterales bacterium]